MANEEYQRLYNKIVAEGKLHRLVRVQLQLCELVDGLGRELELSHDDYDRLATLLGLDPIRVDYYRDDLDHISQKPNTGLTEEQNKALLEQLLNFPH